MYSRRSHDGSTTPMQDNRDVFDDEFAVDDFDMVADGFRPESTMEGNGRHSPDPPIRTVSAHYATTPDLITAPSAPSRSSISKPRANENPFASPDDGPPLEFERSPSVLSHSTANFAPGLARLSTSSASSHLYAGTHSPRFGTGGPSHPYAMYPQATLARSPSVATTSTIQPNRTSIAQQAPQHPYGMYPQGISAEYDLEDEDDAPTTAPAVGFPGLGQTYERVRGPDGEEQDIVGLDGHAEQLPPYTRYPDDGPKMAMPILAVPGELHSRGPVAGSDPGMSLMHQHIAPPVPPPMAPQSMTDQSALERHSIQDRGIDSSASMPLMERVDSESTGVSKKSWSQKSWKEKRKTKVCGMPLLWLIMGICAAGFIGAIVGGIMAGYASGSKHGRDKADAETSSSSSSSVAEASMIAAPTVSPPSGTYALSLTTPTNIASGCLVNQNYAPAWDCNLVGSPALAISVGVPAAPRPTEGAFFFYASSDPGYEYGAQYKFMDTDFSTYQPVQESGEEDKGPAYYFGQTYDKVVLLPESAFPQPSATSNSKRDFKLPPGWNERKQGVHRGEKPWMCVWNDTLIEGWIYVEQNITSSFPVTTSSSSYSTPTSNHTPMTNSVSTYTTSPTSTALTTEPRAQLVTHAFPTTASSGSQTTFTTTVSSILTTTPDSWTMGRGPPPGKFDDADDHESGETSGHARHKRSDLQISTTTAASDGSGKSDDSDDNGKLTPEQEEALDTYHGLPPYPYLIKIEERRIQKDGNTPYCQQYQLLDNGVLTPYIDPSHPSGIKLDIAEQPPPYSAYDENLSISSKQRAAKRDPSTGACHCEWWAQ